jgi:hypothetical protein
MKHLNYNQREENQQTVSKIGKYKKIFCREKVLMMKKTSDYCH